MKLYGVAVALMSKKKTPYTVNMAVNPISYSGDKSRSFEIMADKAFKQAGNFFDSPEDIVDSFVRMVKTIEDIVQLQEQSCKEHGVPYQPVALYIGHDAKNQMMNPMLAFLFGIDMRLDKEKHKSSIKIASKIVRAAYAISEQASDKSRFRFRAETMRDLMARPNGRLRKKAMRYALKHNITEQYKSEVHFLIDNSVISNLGGKRFMKMLLTNNIRNNLLENNNEKAGILLDNCEKFGMLLEKCLVIRGEFSSGIKADHYDKLEPNELDQTLAEIKKDFEDGDPSAIEKVKELARLEGIKDGKYLGSNRTRSFAMHMLAKELAKDLEDRGIIRITFLHWHPDLRWDYYDGFDSVYKGKSNCRLKLPLDPPSPPFTNPLHEVLMDQFDVLEDKRKPEDVRQDKEFQNTLMKGARTVVENAKKKIGNIENMKSRRSHHHPAFATNAMLGTQITPGIKTHHGSKMPREYSL